MASSKDTVFSFRVSADLLARFQEYARSQGVPASALLRDYMAAASDCVVGGPYVLVPQKSKKSRDIFK